MKPTFNESLGHGQPYSQQSKQSGWILTGNRHADLLHHSQDDLSAPNDSHFSHRHEKYGFHDAQQSNFLKKRSELTVFAKPQKPHFDARRGPPYQPPLEILVTDSEDEDGTAGKPDALNDELTTNDSSIKRVHLERKNSFPKTAELTDREFKMRLNSAKKKFLADNRVVEIEISDDERRQPPAADLSLRYKPALEPPVPLALPPAQNRPVDKYLKAKSGVYKQPADNKENREAQQQHQQQRKRHSAEKERDRQSRPATFKEKFTVTETLSKSRRGVLRKAVGKKDGKVYVVKSCRTGDESALSYIKKELKILKMLAHPNIIKTYGIFESTSNTHLLLKHFEGETLAQRLKQTGPLGEEPAKNFMQKLAVALKFCHEIGVAHRNLSAEKLLLNHANHFILIDFAFACSSLTGKKSEAFYGTPPYIAPEHVLKQPHDPKKADMWAFGVIAFKLITGEFPFGEKPEASRVVEDDFDREKLQGCSRSFMNFLGRTLEKDPEKRSTAKQLLQDSWIKLVG